MIHSEGAWELNERLCFYTSMVQLHRLPATHKQRHKRPLGVLLSDCGAYVPRIANKITSSTIQIHAYKQRILSIRPRVATECDLPYAKCERSNRTVIPIIPNSAELPNALNGPSVLARMRAQNIYTPYLVCTSVRRHIQVPPTLTSLYTLRYSGYGGCWGEFVWRHSVARTRVWFYICAIFMSASSSFYRHHQLKPKQTARNSHSHTKKMINIPWRAPKNTRLDSHDQRARVQ